MHKKWMYASIQKRLSKKDLKLKKAMAFENGKKSADAFNEMFGVEDIYT